MRPIVCDPGKFDGAPHVEGTSFTVAEIKAYWSGPGVTAVDIRRRFPDLSETELGAAVTYAPRRDPQFVFVAESEGPPRRRLHIRDEAVGWRFACDEIDANGDAQPRWDTWEEDWDRILLYPPEYAPSGIVWRDADTGAVVDIYRIQPERC
ncbi:DUF433 domain-containing protein [Terricaulis sp.]|uniref:DUF433 domain-containing protein n=1 Tax=Terricaulis sp. TaxID=2768686 RepID=UPI0037835F20